MRSPCCAATSSLPCSSVDQLRFTRWSRCNSRRATPRELGYFSGTNPTLSSCCEPPGGIHSRSAESEMGIQSGDFPPARPLPAAPRGGSAPHAILFDAFSPAKNPPCGPDLFSSYTFALMRRGPARCRLIPRDDAGACPCCWLDFSSGRPCHRGKGGNHPGREHRWS